VTGAIRIKIQKTGAEGICNPQVCLPAFNLERSKEKQIGGNATATTTATATVSNAHKAIRCISLPILKNRPWFHVKA
jgi:hypothetical protein